MTSEDKTWESLKTEYLRQVEKALSLIKDPRRKEVLEDVRSHLDRRFSELKPDQRTWENMQRIITDMGPPSDYAELLEPDTVKHGRNVRARYLLWVGIGAVIVIVAVFLPKLFRPRPATDEDLEKLYKIDRPSLKKKAIDKSYIPSTSIVKDGRIVDKIDYPFVNDPEALGCWESVDFVNDIEDFRPDGRNWKGDLFLKELFILENGGTNWAFTWTKGLILHHGEKTASEYLIKEMNGSAYMFFEWKSGDYTIRHSKPSYYVLKKAPEKPHVESLTTDKIDYPFVDDPQVIGTWEAIDFVEEPQQFRPGKRQWKGGELFLKKLVILPDGKMARPGQTWTKGLILNSANKTASRYLINELNGSAYMFFEWKSGDYTIRRMKPKYYVLRKVRENRQAAEQPGSTEGHMPDINAKVAQLDIDTATFDDVIRIFGEPERYLWGGKTFTKDGLPSVYIAAYPNGFRVVMTSGKVNEVRFERPGAGYLYKDRIQIGSLLDDVLEVVGEPASIVVGAARREIGADGVLYKDIDDERGFCYYKREDQNVKFFFGNYKVSGLYLTGSHYGKSSGAGSFKTVRAVKSVDQFDDVRWKDLSKLSLSDLKGIMPTLEFNKKTVWPEAVRPFAEELLKKAMNPGLGVRKLHEQGITGKGVNVAIIDQPLYQDHPEFAGKIVAYHDTGCETDESSMHGPAVASLLVGTNCGTAPGARVYYAAAPSWKRDAAYYAKGLDWIIAQNEKLPKGEKIRVVSVSASPNQSSWANRQMWDMACARAEADGIMVLDCTNSHRGFVGRCWYDARNPENVAKCNPGAPPNREFRFNPTDIGILVPSSPRTTAEDSETGEFGYQYCGKGGLSWAIPYCAGVLAMGWQVNPDLSPQQMRELLFQSAYTKRNGAKIISPHRFIQLVKSAKTIGWRSVDKRPVVLQVSSSRRKSYEHYEKPTTMLQGRVYAVKKVDCTACAKKQPLPANLNNGAVFGVACL